MSAERKRSSKINNDVVVELIEKSKIIVIIRYKEYDKLEKIVEAIYSGGIRG